MNRQKIVERFHEIISPEFKEWLENNDFYVAPAAINHHGNEPEGLLKHSVEVTRYLVKLTENLNLKWQRPESPIIVGMLHDLCKIDNWEIDCYSDEGGIAYKYRGDTLYGGHGDKSVILAASHMRLTDEEVACIRYHMGAFTDSKYWEYYTRAVKQYPNALFTHTADMLASQVKGV